MNVYFGGPDKDPYFLRNLLAERLSQTEKGGEIFWITYYFRDFYLAEKLMEAAKNGVKVSIVLESKPRVKSANDKVYNILKNHSNINLKYVSHETPHKKIFGSIPKIHEKIYYFSSPQRICYIGSFNPSSSVNDNPEIVKLIGDQDRGHNFLVEITDESLLDELREHCSYMYNIRHGMNEMLKRYQSKIENNHTQIYFYPWANKKIIMSLFDRVSAGDKLLIAESHFTAKIILNKLIGLSKNGVEIKIIAHGTKRRFPLYIEKILKEKDIEYYRYIHPKEYPMHNKFIILEKKNEKLVAFGSLNFTKRSIYESHEILAVTKDTAIIDSFKNRWETILKEVTENNYL
jgi:phosphatidylserine/phosphatidylglycerophosphate/cardiolipin synthase-like enzyme